MSRKIYNRLSFMAVSWLDESTLRRCYRTAETLENALAHGSYRRGLHLPSYGRTKRSSLCLWLKSSNGRPLCCNRS